MCFAGLLSVVVALVLAAPAVAQLNSYTISVPFSFNVNAHVLPAGEYVVHVVAPGAVQIRGVDHIANATFLAPALLSRPLHASPNAKLVFHRYGRMYFLAQVWFSDVNDGYELTITNTEREYAQQTPSTETVLRAAK